MSPQLPRTLFRYQRFSEWLRPVLVKGEVYLPLLHELNDPCEYCYEIDVTWNEDIAREQLREVLKGNFVPPAVRNANRGIIDVDAAMNMMRQLPFEKALELARMGAANQTDAERRRMVEAQMRIDASTIGILCLSQKGYSSYMSYHYADHHAGVCLEFSTKMTPFEYAKAVRYQDNPPLLRVIGDPSAAYMARIFFKASEWKQESEWRLVNHRVNNGPIGLTPPNALVSISLCPSFDTALNLPKLRGWLDERSSAGHARPELFQLKRHQTSYGLTREQLKL